MSSVDAGEHVQVRQTTQSSGYVADDAVHPGLQFAVEGGQLTWQAACNNRGP